MNYTFKFLQKEAKKKKSKIFCNDNLVEPLINYPKHKYFIDNNIEFYIVDNDDNEPHIIIKKDKEIEKIYFKEKFLIKNINFTEEDINKIKEELSDKRAIHFICTSMEYEKLRVLYFRERI